MVPSTAKPTIVIVPGSFSPTSFYDTFISKLSAYGYNAVAVALPSVGGKTVTDMRDDAVAVRKVTSKLIDEGKNVVLVSHSYGGLPATESAEGLSKKEREASGETGGISALLYVTALLVAPGESLADVMGTEPADYVRMDGDFMHLEDNGNAALNFSDLPKTEGLAWAAKMPHHSAATFGGRLTYATYRHIPSFYLHMLDDKTIPLEMQKGMVERANAEMKDTVLTYSLPGGHFPFVSRPEAVAEVVMKVAEQTL